MSLLIHFCFPWPEAGESGFSRVEGESVENILDRINKIDRIGDDENPDNPVNPVKKTLHVSTRLNNSVSSVVENITQTAQAILLPPPSTRGDVWGVAHETQCRLSLIFSYSRHFAARDKMSAIL